MADMTCMCLHVVNRMSPYVQQVLLVCISLLSQLGFYECGSNVHMYIFCLSVKTLLYLVFYAILSDMSHGVHIYYMDTYTYLSILYDSTIWYALCIAQEYSYMLHSKSMLTNNIFYILMMAICLSPNIFSFCFTSYPQTRTAIHKFACYGNATVYPCLLFATCLVSCYWCIQ